MSRKLNSQNGKCLYWNHASFWFFFQNITFHKLKFCIFMCHVFTFLEKINVQVNSMMCLWFNKISLTANAHVIMQKYISYLLNKFTHNTSLVVSLFLWRELCLITLKNWIHPPYLRHNFILVYIMKLIRIAIILRIILQFILTKQMIAPFLTTMWDHMDSCENQYHCA